MKGPLEYEDDDLDCIDDFDIEDIDYEAIDLMTLVDCGPNRPESYEDAWRMYLPLADGGSPEAQYNIGMMYGNGMGVPESPEDAFEWFMKSAEQGEVDAMYHVGLAYEHGWGVEQSYEEAFGWYRDAADAGEQYSCCRLGVLYEFGLGAPQSYEKALEYHMKAAEEGDMESMWEVIHLSWSGCADVPEGVIDGYRSEELFDTMDLCMLGIDYYDGEFNPQSYEKAASLFKMADEEGSEDGRFNLAYMYEMGLGVEGDLEKAIPMYESLLEGDIPNADAAYRLAIMHERGKGFDVDPKAAHRLYKIAANNGNIDAMYRLGLQYETGIGVERDLESAMDWYDEAAEGGHEEAEDRIEALESEMNRGD